MLSAFYQVLPNGMCSLPYFLPFSCHSTVYYHNLLKCYIVTGLFPMELLNLG